jgi:hypothetical protein
MLEAILLIVGAAIGALTSVALHHYERWRAFQEEIGIIIDRFDAVGDDPENIGHVWQVYQQSKDDVAQAVNRVRPYLIFRSSRDRLKGLLAKYREADHSHEAGLALEISEPWKPEQWFLDYRRAKGYLKAVLDEMERL